MNREVICFDAVAPARERGLKCFRHVVQWGLASTETGRYPAPFPIAFPNAVFSVVAVSNYTSCAISKPTLTGFNTTLGSDKGDGLLWWIAVGR